MPTREALVLQFIQRIFLHNGGVLFVSGNAGSGKSALQQLLLLLFSSLAITFLEETVAILSGEVN